MFRYLSNNLRGSRESSIKKTVIRIEKLRQALVMKLSTLDPEEDKVAIENIDNILLELKILKNIIIDSLKSDNKQIRCLPFRRDAQGMMLAAD